ncbi:MAG: YkvA family protein [Brevinematales bacterium]
MKLSVLRKIQVLSMALRHPECSWYAKMVIVLTLAMALSPIDLIPDFIPILGHLDDLLLIPLGIALAYVLLPQKVIEECEELIEQKESKLPKIYGMIGAVCVIVGYVVVGLIVIWFVFRGTNSSK